MVARRCAIAITVQSVKTSRTCGNKVHPRCVRGRVCGATLEGNQLAPWPVFARLFPCPRSLWTRPSPVHDCLAALLEPCTATVAGQHSSWRPLPARWRPSHPPRTWCGLPTGHVQAHSRWRHRHGAPPGPCTMSLSVSGDFRACWCCLVVVDKSYRLSRSVPTNKTASCGMMDSRDRSV